LSDYHKLNQLQAKQLWQPTYITKKGKYYFQVPIMEGNTSNRTGNQCQGIEKSFDVSVVFYQV